MKNLKSYKRGFTLIELLVVVAIIGILATIGIPTFRRMVQKSKQSEAKTALGALFTAQVAFHSEYATYGNDLPKIGFDLTGLNRIYTVGFPVAACTTLLDPALFPAPGTLPFCTRNPTYCAHTNATGFTSVSAGNSPTPAACFVPPAVTANAFTGAATGFIAPTANPATLLQGDQWTINDTRNLVNLQDGIF